MTICLADRMFAAVGCPAEFLRPPPTLVEVVYVPERQSLNICPQCGTEYPANGRFCAIDGTALRSATIEQDMVGSIIADRYLILKKLGEGGMGRVYLAEHVNMGRKCALKVMHASMVKDVDAASRFNREAANASKISHPNVAAVYDFGATPNGIIYLAMEFVDGPTLTELIERVGALPARRAAEIALQVAEALAAAHALGIVHRDLRPHNIMMANTRDGADLVKVVDFGITNAAGRDAQKVTKTGLVVGTPEYMSPEQIVGDKLDGRSDIYSLGLIAFNMLTGTLPFPSNSAQESMITRLTDKPKPLADMRPEISWPPEMQRVMDRVLERDAALRYQTSREFAGDLARVIQQSPLIDWPASATRPDAMEGGVGITQARAARSATPIRVPLEETQFTIYRPKAVQPGRWYPMLALMHLAERRPDAPAGEPDPIEQMRARAKQVLGNVSAFRNTSVDARHGVPRAGDITLIPYAAGVEFNPARRAFQWQEDVHHEEFRLRAEPHLEGQVARGRLAAYFGMILLADIDISFRVDATASDEQPNETLDQVTGTMYRKIFASYSHKDVEIVRQHERYVETLGDRYLRDVRNLRAGEQWKDALLTLIDQADVFQLFWSRNAMRSPNVRQEWEYALSLNRAAFVRPTYWEDPLPESPAEGLPPDGLRRLHFHRIGRAGAGSSPADVARSVAIGSPNSSPPDYDIPRRSPATPNRARLSRRWSTVLFVLASLIFGALIAGLLSCIPSA